LANVLEAHDARWGRGGQETFQSIEAGIFVALTAAALGAAIWLLRRRPA
jgi:hypothetical protein